jgi:hypothetical protein
LLGTDGFAELRGPKRVRGRQVLAEAEQALLHLRDASEADLEVMNCNKALLLLALGQPDRAYDVLASRTPGGRLRDSAAAFAAIALNRMARVREALAVLDDAEKATGETKILMEAREHIKSGKHFAGVVSVATNENPIRRIKRALFDLSQMDHYRQAEVLAETSEPFESVVIEHVRVAAENVTSLVPLTRFAKTDPLRRRNYRTYPHATGRQCPLSKMDSYLSVAWGLLGQRKRRQARPCHRTERLDACGYRGRRLPESGDV